MYIADIFNNRVRKVTPAGVVSTYAGSGTATFADGMGSSASFNHPVGVATDAMGNVYVADEYNNRVRKIAPDGMVTTLAGSGSAGFVNGTGTGASFYNPHGVAVDESGNVYVADRGNHCVRKITSGGVVTTLAGNGAAGLVDGVGSSARLNDPTCICLDPFGNVIVADLGTHTLRKITMGGVVTTLAGAGTYGYVDATGTAAKFHQPIGVTSDASGNIYVADADNHAIRKVTPAGVVTTLVGKGGTSGYLDGDGAVALLNYPGGLDINNEGDLVYVCSSNQRVRKVELCVP
jgi:sugar lactone lactonase YvrE